MRGRMPPRQRTPAPAMPPPPPPQQRPPVLRAVTGDHHTIDCKSEPFSSGSEGRLYFTLDGTHVIKIYSNPEQWRELSLDAIIKKRTAVMAGNPEYWSVLFCWPEARVIQPEWVWSCAGPRRICGLSRICSRRDSANAFSKATDPARWAVGLAISAF